MDTLLKDLDFENIPSILGGGFSLYNEPFDFDTSPGGPLHYDAAERDSAKFLEEIRKEVASKIIKAEVSQKSTESAIEVDPVSISVTTELTSMLETTSNTIQQKEKPIVRVESVIRFAAMKNAIVRCVDGWEFTLRYCWHEHPIHSLLILLTLTTLFYSDYYSFLQLIFAITFSGVVLIIVQ
jgi:hypothetical protein